MPNRLIAPALGLIAALLITPWFILSSPEVLSSDPPAPTMAVQPVVAVFSIATTVPEPPVQVSAPVVPPPTARPKIPQSSSVSSINGIPINRIVVVTDAVRKHVREIFARGQTLRRNPRALSKVGDSTMAYPPFLAAFDGKAYRLGPFANLQGSIDRFAGSFGRESVAERVGMHTWSEFDIKWANATVCQPQEGPLACELRLNNPSVAMIRLGANDVSAPKLFNTQLRRIVDASLDGGVVPVLGTKPDRQEGEANTLNQLVRQIAVEYRIPLWDYDWVAGTVPGRGLENDRVHMRGGGTHDYASSRAMQSGDSLEDLTALLVLDAIRQDMPIST